jgi:hypothetical protein
MANERPEVDTEEFIQSRLERAVREQLELHGWATAVSVANPVDILILFEDCEYEEGYDLKPIKTSRHYK